MTVAYNLHVGTAAPAGPAWPVSVDPGGRYIKDQYGQPWLMSGDSPHTILRGGQPANVTMATITGTYLPDRASKGFNCLWVELLTDGYIACSDSSIDQVGNLPFTSGDITRPIEAYWARLDTLVAACATNGITCYLTPVETAGAAMTFARNGGNTGCNTYGQFLGNRYKASPNIIWGHGNDYGGNTALVSGPPSATDNALMENIYAGIKTAGDTHLQTCQLNFMVSLTTDDSSTGGWRTISDLNLVYTYYQTYDMVRKGYLGINSNDSLAQAQRYTPKPVFLGEGNYEGEDNVNGGAHPATPYTIRAQAYWTVLAGGLVGQMWGNAQIWQFATGWDTGTGILSAGSVGAGIWATFFRSIAFHTLVPDGAHTFVTSGFGTYNGNFSVPGADTTDLVTTTTANGTSTYATAALAADGSLGVVYTPVIQGLVVDMTKMRGTITARWFDPTLGTYSSIGSFANAGSHTFTPSGTHSDGKPDWVLVLTA